jgi:DNA polymerase V
MPRAKTHKSDSEPKENRFGIASGSVVGQDLNQLLVHRPESTFYLKMATDQPELNLFRGDILMVDRSLTPKSGNLVIITDEEHFRASRYRAKVEIWGVVTYIIHQELNG